MVVGGYQPDANRGSVPRGPRRFVVYIYPVYMAASGGDQLGSEGREKSVGANRSAPEGYRGAEDGEEKRPGEVKTPGEGWAVGRYGAGRVVALTVGRASLLSVGVTDASDRYTVTS